MTKTELPPRASFDQEVAWNHFQVYGKLTREEAYRVLDVTGLTRRAEANARDLTPPEKRRLEVARALATQPKLLLLDEVLAGLNPTEIRDIVPVIRDLCRRGVTILMIEHVMQAVMSLAEHVFVLAEGRVIAQGAPAQIAQNPQVVEAYLGHGAAAKWGAPHAQ